ncbi:MAG TPA: DinB family protein [Bryobacteraceae bacterium]|nr:DinB family protein [Bryobacteraceae bacterium]
MTQIDPGAVIEMLKTTPRRIASASRGFSDKELSWKPAADSWSANEVLAHLRACADVWGGSILKILKQDNPTFRYVSPRTWIRKTNYLDLDFKASCLAFRKQREDLLKVLQSVPQEDWLRRAKVKAAAKLREETVLSYAQRLGDHEARHCEQMDRVLHARLLSGQRG